MKSISFVSANPHRRGNGKNQLRKLKVEAATRKSFPTSRAALFSGGGAQVAPRKSRRRPSEGGGGLTYDHSRLTRARTFTWRGKKKYLVVLPKTENAERNWVLRDRSDSRSSSELRMTQRLLAEASALRVARCPCADADCCRGKNQRSGSSKQAGGAETQR